MTEPRIGRLLVASLHQAIADLLPNRLEFYENWLSVSGLRDGTIGLAPLSAVLSFLRNEGDAYGFITERAGLYAAEWTLSERRGLERRVMRSLPAGIRMRAALRSGCALVRATYPGSRAIARIRRGEALVDLRGSLFCEVREASMLPLCGFYAAAITRVLEDFGVRADARVTACRAAGGRSGCLLAITMAGSRADEPAAAA